MKQLPIACSLDAADAKAQLAAWRALAPFELSREPLPGGVRLTYRSEAAGEVEHVAAAEQRCCGFLDIAVEDLGDRRAVTILAPDEVLAGDVRRLGLA